MIESQGYCKWKSFSIKVALLLLSDNLTGNMYIKGTLKSKHNQG